ncbi:MAG: hypothetical protein HZB19_15255 [Chloroflexi bacterium]|nr:hypothetical protein [Chloroflexota bacterium]
MTTNTTVNVRELVTTGFFTGDWSEFDKHHQASMDAIFGVMQLRREFRVTRSLGCVETGLFFAFDEVKDRFLFACTGFVQGRLL